MRPYAPHGTIYMLAEVNLKSIAVVGEEGFLYLDGENNLTVWPGNSLMHLMSNTSYLHVR